MVGGPHEEAANFKCNEGFISNLERHEGLMPHELAAWYIGPGPEDSVTEWEPDSEIMFTSGDPSSSSKRTTLPSHRIRSAFAKVRRISVAVVAWREAAKAAADVAKRAGMAPAEIARHTAHAAQAAGALPSDCAQAAGNASKAAGGMPSDVAQAAGNAAAEAAMMRGDTRAGVVKLAAEAAKLASIESGETPAAAAKAAVDAAKAAGAAPAHLANFAVDGGVVISAAPPTEAKAHAHTVVDAAVSYQASSFATTDLRVADATKPARAAVPATKATFLEKAWAVEAAAQVARETSPTNALQAEARIAELAVVPAQPSFATSPPGRVPPAEIAAALLWRGRAARSAAKVIKARLAVLLARSAAAQKSDPALRDHSAPSLAADLGVSAFKAEPRLPPLPQIGSLSVATISAEFRAVRITDNGKRQGAAFPQRTRTLFPR